MEDDQLLIMDLYAIASDHQHSKRARVEQMAPLLLAVESKKFQQNRKAWYKSDYYWKHFKPQVLKDRTAETMFFGEFIQEIFKKHEHVESFSWRQTQDFNDNWHYFDLQNLSINDFEVQYDAGFDWYGRDAENFTIIDQYDNFSNPPYELVSGLEAEFEGKKSSEEIRAFAADLFSSFYQPPFDIFQVFLQSLHRAYHANYFIDLFGWCSSVYINRDGIRLEGVVREPPHPAVF